MRVQKLLGLLALPVCMAVSISLVTPEKVSAQAVSAVTLQVVPTQSGQQGVITPRGMVVPLPGAGVNSNVVQIYMGQQGGYWYVDKNGQTVDLTMAVQQFRSMTGQPAQQVPQYAPPPPQQSSGGGGGASALGTAAAASMGAMAGAAMTGAYYNNNIPYGTPVYHPYGKPPYYVNAGGNTVNVTNQQNYEANAAVYNQHANNYEKQNQWYANQQKQNADQFKQWQKNADNNPFVSNASADGGRFGRRGADSGNADGGGRFGRRFGGGDGNSDGGGRFGRRFGGGDGNSDGGGRFGNNGVGDGDGGGRLGNRGAGDGDGGGRLGNRGAGDGDGGGRLGNRSGGDGAGLGGRRRGR